MSGANLSFDIVAKDRASDKFDHLGNAVERSGGKMRAFGKVAKVAALGLAAGVAAAGYAGVKFAEAAAQDEQSAAIMAKTFKSAANATDAQVAATERWITKTSLASGVADDEMRPALSKLVVATGDVSKAQELMQLAMNASAGTGRSLDSVSQALARGYNGTTASLGKMNVQTKSAAGNALTFAHITQKMGETFGGAMATKAKTAAGSLARLKVMFSETGEAIGYKLLPIATALMNFLLDDLAPAVKPVVKAFKDMIHVGWEKLQKGADAVKDFFKGAKGHAALAGSMTIMGTAAGHIKTGFEKAKQAIKGIRTEVDKIDFANLDSKKVGALVGTAIAAGLTALTGMAGTLSKALGDLFKKVDWVGLGLEMGKQVPALLFGLAVGILAFDPTPILIGLKDHWGEVLLAVLAIAFAPAKIAGGLAKVLTKIPFVGKFMAASVVWLNDLGGKLASFGGDLFGAMWKGFSGGKALPGAGIVSKVLGGLRGIPGAVRDFFKTLGTHLGVWSLDAFEAIGRGARTAIGAVIRFHLELPGRIISALGNISRLLFPKGMALIDGLAEGLGKRWEGAVSWFKSIPAKVLGAVGNLGEVLRNAGQAIISGLIKGVMDKFDDLKNALGAVGNFIKDHKGPIDKDLILLRPAGRAIMDGLIAGIEDRQGRLHTVLMSVSKFIGASFGEMLQDQLDTARGALGGMRDARNASFGAFSGFGSNIFGADISGGEGGTGPTGVDAILAFGASQAAQAKQTATDVAHLVALGLSSDLIEQMKSQGASGIANIHALAGATPAQIAQLNADAAASAANWKVAGVATADSAAAMMTAGSAVTELAKQLQSYLNAPVPFEFHQHLEGKTLVTSIKAYKRGQGNVPLGIA